MHITRLHKLRFDQISCSGTSGMHWQNGVSKWYEIVKRLGTPALAQSNGKLWSCKVGRNYGICR